MKYYIFILITVIMTVIAQLLVKFTTFSKGAIPGNSKEILPYFFSIILDWRVILALSLGFLGFLFYFLAIKHLDLSYAYPFMGLSFVLVALFSGILFHEHVGLIRWLGIASIVLGIILVAKTGG